MRTLIFGILVVVFYLYACQKKPENFYDVVPIKVSKELVCQNTALLLELEQTLSQRGDMVKLIIQNQGSQALSGSDSIVLSIHFYKNDTLTLENLHALHVEKIKAPFAVGDRIYQVVNGFFPYPIHADNIEVAILKCPNFNNAFSGIYTGDYLVPKFQATRKDTVPGEARCQVDADGNFKLWLEQKSTNANFKTRNIIGNVNDNGLLAAEAYEGNQTFVSFMNTDSLTVAPLDSSQQLQFNLFFRDRQVIYDSDTCTNLILDLSKIY
ncbi:MAG: hypothetical protein AB8E82_17450 [Aureispira sp.]